MTSKSFLARSPNIGRWQMSAYGFFSGLRIAIGLVFCVSGILKLANRDEFVKALTSYEFFNDWVTEGLALALPFVEIGFGAMFALGLKTRLISSMLVALLVVFSLIGLVAFSQGRSVECGCFPIEGAAETVGIGLFIRNGLLIVGCLFIGAFSQRETGRMLCGS